MTKARDLANLISAGILADGAISVSEISDLTATASDLNNVAGINSSVQTQLDGKQAVVSGVSSTEIGYLDGVTSALQTQLNNISVTSGSLTKSFTSGETASITLGAAISPAPVVSATKEVAQVGIVSKGAWDVNATASNYGLHNTAYDTTLTTGATLTLGTGSFAATDVGKRIVGNGGDVVLTSTAGAYDTTGGSAFTDGSTIASGSWSMRGLKSAGASSGLTIESFLSTTYDVAGSSSTADASYVPSGPSGHKGFDWSTDGTKYFALGDNNVELYSFSVSTPFDISTSSTYTGVSTILGNYTNQPNGVLFNPNGTQFLIADNANNRVLVFNLSTAWDVTSIVAATTGASGGGYGTPTAMLLGDNGSTLWVHNEGNGIFYKHEFSTAYDFNTISYNSGVQVDTGQYGVNNVWGAAWNGDGTKVFMLDDSADRIWSWPLTTAYDLTSKTGNPTQEKQLAGLAWRSLRFSANGTKMHILRESGTTIEQYDVGSFTIPTAQYHIATTNSGGQISTAFWTDLNTMVADQAAGGGTVNYAVSTDNKTIWSVIKEGSGVRPIVRNNSGTWQYNNDSGTSAINANISSATYSNKSFNFSTQDNGLRSVFFKTDGTSMYSIGGSGNINQYTLSTAWDVSSASYANKNFSVSGFEGSPEGLYIKPDGTKAYYVGKQQDTVRRLSLSTAWDISTASYDGNGISVAGQENALTDIWFKPDGTRMYVIGTTNDTVYQYTLSTAWDETTASNTASFSVASQGGGPSGVTFNTAGTKLYVAGESSAGVSQYTLSTAWDVSTASYDSVLLDVSSTVGGVQGAVFGDNGSKIYVSGQSASTVYQYTNGTISYSTSTTWANSTTNDEFYALQQALSAQAFNRMDKTQLDAVTDPNHYTLANTLDLMIALYLPSSSTSSPTADGVSINYDAAALNQGAVLGTDYDYDFPNSTTVRVTSNAAQNLKVRVV